MSTEAQGKYIADLAVLKTKEFKEVKELLIASNIVSDSADTVAQSQTIAEITNALTDLQASQFIDLLTAAKVPTRGRAYSKRRVETAASMVSSIKDKIDGWNFDGLR